jgi:hypothetical protein
MTYTFKHESIEAFKRSWPCSGIPALESISFDFDGSDLVEIIAIDEDSEYIDSAEFDGPALLALSQDAWKVIEAL